MPILPKPIPLSALFYYLFQIDISIWYNVTFFYSAAESVTPREGQCPSILWSQNIISEYIILICWSGASEIIRWVRWSSKCGLLFVETENSCVIYSWFYVCPYYFKCTIKKLLDNFNDSSVVRLSCSDKTIGQSWIVFPREWLLWEKELFFGKMTGKYCRDPAITALSECWGFQSVPGHLPCSTIQNRSSFFGPPTNNAGDF